LYISSDNGDIIKYDPKKMHPPDGFIYPSAVMIDGSVACDIYRQVLRDRLLLADDGIADVTSAINHLNWN